MNQIDKVVINRKNNLQYCLTEEVYQQYQYNASMPPPSTMDKRHPGFREELGYIPPPNRKLPPVPNSQYNTCDRIKRGRTSCGTYLSCFSGFFFQSAEVTYVVKF